MRALLTLGAFVLCCAGPLAIARTQTGSCAIEQRDIAVTEGTIAALEGTIKARQEELGKLAAPAQRLTAEAAALAGPAQRELVGNLLVTAFRKVVELGARFALATVPGLEDIEKAVGLVELGDVGDLLDLVPFWKEMTGYFDLLHGAFETDLGAVKRYAADNDVPLVKRFLAKLGELEDLRDNAGSIANRLKAAKVQLLQTEAKLKEQKRDLAACLTAKKGKCAADFPSATLETMRWSEWHWTLSSVMDDKSLNVAFGGHGKSWGRGHSETTISATVRATTEEVRDKLVFGRATGRFITRASGEFVYADGFREPYDSQTNNPLKAAGELRLRSTNDDGHDYQLVFTEVSPDRGRAVGVGGHACNGDFGYQTVQETGDPNGQIWSRSTESWKATIVAVDAPPHAALVNSLPAESALEDGVRAFTSRLSDAVAPAIRRLSLARRYQESATLAGLADKTGDWFRNQGPSRDDDLARADIRELRTHLTEFWLSGEPDADNDYKEALADLRSAIAKWQAVKRLVEDKLIAATADAQARVGTQYPVVVKDLQALVDQLRRRGLESFLQG
jgi:hypothetical protein